MFKYMFGTEKHTKRNYLSEEPQPLTKRVSTMTPLQPPTYTEAVQEWETQLLLYLCTFAAWHLL